MLCSCGVIPNSVIWVANMAFCLCRTSKEFVHVSAYQPNICLESVHLTSKLVIPCIRAEKLACSMSAWSVFCLSCYVSSASWLLSPHSRLIQLDRLMLSFLCYCFTRYVNLHFLCCRQHQHKSEEEGKMVLYNGGTGYHLDSSLKMFWR